MKLLRNLDDFSDELRGGAVTIGNFDGVHRGHALLVKRLCELAREIDGPSVAFTFDPPPAWLLRPDAAPQPLIWTQRKVEILAQLGADAVLVYPTDRALLELDAREFFERVVLRRLGVKAMVEGPNFFFGHNRIGTVELLRQFCAEAGIRLEVTPSVEVNGQIVSSSLIRSLVFQGRMMEARQMLGRPYRIRGIVVRSAGRGVKLGYPTANIEQIDTILPPDGIYAGRAWVDQDVYTAAISLGSNPTFDETALKVEVYLLDFHGDLYGRPLQIDFLTRLRETKRFDSVDALVAQMALDVAAVRSITAELENENPELNV
ncbi:MAG TPA: bifunctional riboflavin kinase/FAD synthetase [Thermoguttaceae bacterium]